MEKPVRCPRCGAVQFTIRSEGEIIDVVITKANGEREIVVIAKDESKTKYALFEVRN